METLGYNHVMLALFAEMTLDEALRKHKEQKLNAAIDNALRDRDKQAFIKLTDELRELRKY
ncbi:IDEAL domain-containing protein [Paenibacillus sp. sptzw28]|uniref:IDEAL domain-containing protein n=1 Tax=Paenibacillus sp. sptzw28 TaxID=715179 RepID=UPI001C6E6449|nr:IDEAL domain-containing protein [Paenibacillus sp. sptzw28]QYR20998.1 IDEAL domain-containing protein [Paenibacillus sp. sptzw28]